MHETSDPVVSRPDNEQLIPKARRTFVGHLTCARAASGGEAAKSETFRAFWETGAPLVGDEGAQGWADWESKQGRQLHSPALPGALNAAG